MISPSDCLVSVSARLDLSLPHDLYNFIKLKSQGGNVKKIGRPKKNTEQVTLRLETDTIKEIDEARKQQEDLPSRPEMIRRMIDAWLAR